MGDITLRKALDDYKTVYMAYRNFAERTREEYLNDLEDLVGFLEKAGIDSVKKVNLPIIERYVALCVYNSETCEPNNLVSRAEENRYD